MFSVLNMVVMIIIEEQPINTPCKASAPIKRKKQKRAWTIVFILSLSLIFLQPQGKADSWIHTDFWQAAPLFN
jgi:hypothetical protein